MAIKTDRVPGRCFAIGLHDQGGGFLAGHRRRRDPSQPKQREKRLANRRAARMEAMREAGSPADRVWAATEGLRSAMRGASREACEHAAAEATQVLLRLSDQLEQEGREIADE
jgi:hypothetical protein